MNDDQMITLLRDAPLPAGDPSRYEAVVARGRRQDRRRTTIAAASLVVVALAGTVTVLTWPRQTSTSPQSLLSATTSAGTAHVKGTVEGEDGAQRFVGDVDFEHSSARMTLTASGVDVEFLTVGEDTYLRGVFPDAGGGKHWVHSRSSDSGSLSSFDPGALIERLNEEHATLTSQGEKEVNGERVADYLVTGGKADDDRPFAQGTGHIYVGRDGLVRRIVFPSVSRDMTTDLTNGTPTTVRTHEELTTMDFSDYGRPVHIQAPPADDTVEQGTLGGIQGSTPDPTSYPLTLTTPAAMDAATKARLCQLYKDQISKQTQIPQATKDEILKQFCGT